MLAPPFLATYQDLFWMLDDEQQRQVLALPPSAFDHDRGASGGSCGPDNDHLRGDPAPAPPPAPIRRFPVALEAQSRAAPEDGQRHALVGLALAYLGRKAGGGSREGRRARRAASDRAGWLQRDPTFSSSWSGSSCP